MAHLNLNRWREGMVQLTCGLNHLSQQQLFVGCWGPTIWRLRHFQRWRALERFEEMVATWMPSDTVELTGRSKLGSPFVERLWDDLDYSSERKQNWPGFTADLDPHWLGPVWVFFVTCSKLQDSIICLRTESGVGHDCFLLQCRVLYLLASSALGFYMFMFYTHAWQIGMRTPNWPTFFWE